MVLLPYQTRYSMGILRRGCVNLSVPSGARGVHTAPRHQVDQLQQNRLQGFVRASHCHTIVREGNEVVVVAAADRSHRLLETLYGNTWL